MEQQPETPAPPTSPFEAYPDDRAIRQSRWPIVFGAISLVVGVLGTCMQGMGAVMAVASDKFMGMMGMSTSPPPEIVKFVGGAQAVILVLLGVLLTTGAAMMLLRKPLGVTLVRTWAIARLVMVVLGLGAAIMTMKAQVEWQITMTSEIRESLRKNPNIKESQLPPIPDREEAERKALWGIAGASAAFAVWPFVMAIVLSRPNVRADVERWRSAATVA